MNTSAKRAAQSVLSLTMVGLAGIGAKCSDLTGTEAAADCVNNGFKCIHNLNTQGYTCVGHPAIPSSVKVVYACIDNGGQPRDVIPFPTIEELSAWESSPLPGGAARQRCAAKSRCTR